MDVVVNGQARAVAAEETVLGLLRSLGLPEDRVAVELDGQIVKRTEWRERALRPGSRLEIVHFVGGG